jgi:uncharacterized protein (DUF305 family)
VDGPQPTEFGYGARPVSRSRRIVVVGAVTATVVSGLVAGVVLAGGSDGDGSDGDDEVRTVQPGAPGEDGRELTDDELAALDTPGHTAADTAFMQDMLAHHQQALDMAALVAERTERDDLPLLAERITVSQEAEIEQIEEWLTARGEEVPDAAAHEHDEAVPGMATLEQLAQLEEAQGAAFDRLFLDLMIAHHQGALAMVDELYRAGGGLEPAADGLAREVEATQDIEILRMQELLASIE